MEDTEGDRWTIAATITDNDPPPPFGLRRDRGANVPNRPPLSSPLSSTGSSEKMDLVEQWKVSTQ